MAGIHRDRIHVAGGRQGNTTTNHEFEPADGGKVWTIEHPVSASCLDTKRATVSLFNFVFQKEQNAIKFLDVEILSNLPFIFYQKNRIFVFLEMLFYKKMVKKYYLFFLPCFPNWWWIIKVNLCTTRITGKELLRLLHWRQKWRMQHCFHLLVWIFCWNGPFQILRLVQTFRWIFFIHSFHLCYT